MTRKEHLEFCKRCENRAMDANHGIVCSLTGNIADFDDSCESFALDPTVKIAPPVEQEAAMEETVPITHLPENLQTEYRQYQNLPYALVGGIFTVFITSILWAIITVSTEYQIGFMAVGAGLIVGMGIRFFGAGVDPIYQWIGAAFALLSCLLGNYFSQVGFIAHLEGLSYFQTMKLIDIGLIPEMFAEVFSPIDLLFYGLATYEGYRFSIRPLGNGEGVQVIPDLNSMRFPAIIAGFFILGIFVFMLNSTEVNQADFTNGYYENGQVMWEGEYSGEYEHGKWKYYDEDGFVLVSGNYNLGREEGNWTYFNTSGVIIKSVDYQNGLIDGWQISYYDDGSVADSSQFKKHRFSGISKSYYATGHLMSEGHYDTGKREGKWQFYHSNGLLATSGIFSGDKPTGEWKYYNDSGNIIRESEFEDEIERILWAIAPDGQTMVSDGNGHMVHYDDQNRKQHEFDVREGYPTGNFVAFDSLDVITYKGVYENNELLITDAWDNIKDQTVENGNGNFKEYYPSGIIKEEGVLVDGKRQDTWSYYYESGLLASSQDFKNNQLNGTGVYYRENGTRAAEGEWVSNKRSGIWTWYYENGNMDNKVEFVEGQKEGLQLLYSENGYHVLTEEYEQGELIRTTNEPLVAE